MAQWASRLLLGAAVLCALAAASPRQQRYGQRAQPGPPHKVPPVSAPSTPRLPAAPPPPRAEPPQRHYWPHGVLPFFGMCPPGYSRDARGMCRERW
ncbi:basic proline-rich protein-like [Schistocerca piceifrons]|uniref:basic proline-rich protein-like n=1 Tax=Schistocerca piceifrons TaxID=274613 RepID=UPI001F5F0A6D|nr:basic proline-rich protein-like [Schistocerca piceifrons]